MKRSTLCLVDSQDQARSIVEKLTSAGFSQDDISVLFADKESTREFAHEKETKMPEGATIGAGTGGTLGGVVGLMAGLGALAIPGLGPFIAAGPLMAALGGGAIGAGVGGITGALIGLGVPEYEAKRYQGAVKEGGILISVHTDNSDEASKAKDIFKNSGAHDISTTNESRGDAGSGLQRDRDAVRADETGTLTGKTVTERREDAGSGTVNVNTAAPVREVLGTESAGTTSRQDASSTGATDPDRTDDLSRRL